mmetsp:Transcript_7458/g.13489  ORF Transcript_7458/g.13489 Transcript_7458/m.13489 type:complete len:80 (-) Transcript_7458:1328-1567(-)
MIGQCLRGSNSLEYTGQSFKTAWRSHLLLIPKYINMSTEMHKEMHFELNTIVERQHHSDALYNEIQSSTYEIEREIRIC